MLVLLCYDVLVGGICCTLLGSFVKDLLLTVDGLLCLLVNCLCLGIYGGLAILVCLISCLLLCLFAVILLTVCWCFGCWSVSEVCLCDSVSLVFVGLVRLRCGLHLLLLFCSMIVVLFSY